MSEISLPLLRALRLQSFPGVAGRALGRVLALRSKKPAKDAALGLRPQAASAVRQYAREHASLFEREERLRAKAERLERAGTPSESAHNRAERARKELEAGLLALREHFAPYAEEERRAFDQEVGRLYPGLAISGR